MTGPQRVLNVPANRLTPPERFAAGHGWGNEWRAVTLSRILCTDGHGHPWPQTLGSIPGGRRSEPPPPPGSTRPAVGVDPPAGVDHPAGREKNPAWSGLAGHRVRARPARWRCRHRGRGPGRSRDRRSGAHSARGEVHSGDRRRRLRRVPAPGDFDRRTRLTSDRSNSLPAQPGSRGSPDPWADPTRRCRAAHPEHPTPDPRPLFRRHPEQGPPRALRSPARARARLALPAAESTYRAPETNARQPVAEALTDTSEAARSFAVGARLSPLRAARVALRVDSRARIHWSIDRQVPFARLFSTAVLVMPVSHMHGVCRELSKIRRFAIVQHETGTRVGAGSEGS